MSSFLGTNGRFGFSHSITIFGSNLGTALPSTTIRVGHSSCLFTSWMSDTSIFGLFSFGHAGSAGFVITGATSSGSHTDAFSYEFQISSVTTVNVLGYVNRIISSIGGGFGYEENSVQGRLHVTSCERTRWRSNSAITCSVAPGSGHSVGISITVGDVDASISDFVSFDYPLALSPTAVNLLPMGDRAVSMFGSHFSGTSMKAKIMHSISASTIWNSMTSMLLKVFIYIHLLPA